MMGVPPSLTKNLLIPPPHQQKFSPVDFPSPNFYNPHQKTIFMFNTNFHETSPQKTSYLAAVIAPVLFLF